jgi:hypothetical protein
VERVVRPDVTTGVGDRVWLRPKTRWNRGSRTC